MEYDLNHMSFFRQFSDKKSPYLNRYDLDMDLIFIMVTKLLILFPLTRLPFQAILLVCLEERYNR